jgi:hypothetical protein
MTTDVRVIPPEVPSEVGQKVISDVVSALQSVATTNGKFIVNDTLWYAVQRGKVTPCVVNSAHFITGRLQKFLKEAGWLVDVEIEGQEIDGFIELGCDAGLVLDKKGILEILGQGWSGLGAEPDVLFSNLYQYYLVRRCFLLAQGLTAFTSLFKKAEGRTKCRFGLEFETGNIASSFRAFSKLNSLFRLNKIDVGLFITSRDKNGTACRIWPASNRNGSFEELENHDYRRNITLPMIELSFAPDGFDKNGGYLSSDGTTYIATDTGKVKKIQGVAYHVFRGAGGIEILRQTNPATAKHLQPSDLGI